MRYIGGQHQGTCYVNGVEIKEVIECDTELGFAVIYKTDDKGRVEFIGGAPKKMLVTGEVDFTLSPPA